WCPLECFPPSGQLSTDIDAATPINSRKSTPALVFSRPIRFLLPSNPRIPQEIHAPVPLFSAHPARNAERGGDRVASADAARGHDATGGCGHLCVPAAWLSRAAENLPDRTRGTEPVGRDRAVDADDPV